ncbi:hypothetical protein GKR75_07950 [Providencia sp. wls1919]|nr:hypothetical protein [Providencia sp. wls1919]
MNDNNLSETLRRVRKPLSIDYFYCSSGTVDDDIDISEAAILSVNETEKVYFMPDGIWFSSYNWNDNKPSKVRLNGPKRYVSGTGERRKEKIVPAAYCNEMDAVMAYINAYELWEENHKKEYENINIALSIEPTSTNYNSLVGTTGECDYCGNYTKIVEEFNNNAACSACASAIHKR